LELWGGAREAGLPVGAQHLPLRSMPLP
jgi:hypothetical protein